MGFRVFIAGVLILLTFTSLNGQCCSGGVPVSSNLGFESSEKGSFQFSLNADINVLKTLYAASDALDDDLRKRTTQSYLLRGSYSFTSRFSVESFISFVRQTRKIYSNSGGSNFESTFGIGDPVVLFIYNFIENPITWRFGLGPQIPLGSFNNKNNQGLFLLEDLQPGSGAWDLVLFSSLEIPLQSRPTTLFYLNTILNHNGTNPDAREGSQEYKFGNDIQFIGGVGDQFLIGKQIISPGIGMRYRYSKRDEIDGIENSSTGGKFLYLRLSNGFPLPKNAGSFNVNFELPLYTFVNETQLAPTFVLNFGWYKKIKKKSLTQELNDIF